MDAAIKLEERGAQDDGPSGAHGARHRSALDGAGSYAPPKVMPAVARLAAVGGAD